MVYWQPCNNPLSPVKNKTSTFKKNLTLLTKFHNQITRNNTKGKKLTLGLLTGLANNSSGSFLHV